MLHAPSVGPHAQNRNREAIEAELRQRFERHLAHASDEALLQVVQLQDAKAFAALTKPERAETRSADVRSQAAKARMLGKAFDRVMERCELLEASEVVEILGISKQALSQKTKAGQILAYSNQRRKYYPAFQLRGNKIRPEFYRLLKDLGVDPADPSAINFMIQHLISNMDFSEPGEPSNVMPRFKLIQDEAAFQIIKRDYLYAFEMGQ
ncbi:hypothetical protein SJI00_16195 [Pseudomonas sp. RP23018S]|uniref:hypothetical protein n=1 Tax=Pseudomonas sp. RP23018S TaxID=3096037 RepID=UPI002ACA287C|nr:hypothetical protein [Pseudomonas sp. RP23018S]MDZ5604316.1 hypothetical protein [Pseudomonas sp. RP23018S]